MNKINIIIVIVLSLLFPSCQTEESIKQGAKFSGIISAEYSNGSSAVLTFPNSVKHEIPIAEDGSFSFQSKSYNPFTATLSFPGISNKPLPLFCNVNFNIKLKVEKDSIHLLGNKGIEENLIFQRVKKIKGLINSKKTAEQAIKEANEHIESHTNLVKNINNLDSFFKNYVIDLGVYNAINSLESINNLNQRFGKESEEEKLKSSKALNSKIEVLYKDRFTPNKPHYLNMIPSYGAILLNYFKNETLNIEKSKGISSFEAQKTLLKTITNNTNKSCILSYLIRNLCGDIFANGYPMQDVEDSYLQAYKNKIETFYNLYAKDSITYAYDRTVMFYNKFNRTFPGNMSAQFYNLENVNGEKNSLADFKGSYLLIDVWGLWCPGCIAEFPYLKTLKNKFKDKNIKFMGISFEKKDDEYERWKTFVKDKDLGGIQLRVPPTKGNLRHENVKEFYDFYSLKSFPQYILLDPEGKIVLPETPLPSEGDKLEKILTKVLK